MTDQKLTIQPAAAVRHLRHIARVQHAFAHDDDRKPTPEWLAADLIERQERQIERMRAALMAARSTIEADRLALLDCHTDYTGRVDDDGRSAATVYDDALRMIDSAMGGDDAQG